MPFRDTCRKCGARRVDRQIGLEPTPEAWVARLVEVFREVKRVLRPDGTCWVNIGDSYNAQQGSGYPGYGGRNVPADPGVKPRRIEGIKPKDLVGQPWRLAFALQADGWWLRSEIIWAKPNPMPESVSDRPTKAHEQVFLLTKSARYFYDAEAVREAAEFGRREQPADTWNRCKVIGERVNGATRGANPAAGRNARSVWTIATEAFPEAHFATFPQELARRCILAGTSAKGVCPQCGAPWARVVERNFERQSDVSESLGVRGHDGQKPMTNGSGWQGFPRGTTNSETLGWRPTCSCDESCSPGAGNGSSDVGTGHGGTRVTQDRELTASPIRATVLDPFAGSGTTLLVAEQLGRDSIGIELNAEYAEMAERRIANARARRLLGHVTDRHAPLPGQLSFLETADA